MHAGEFTTPVRNLSQARDHVRQHAVKIALASLLRQYGLDDTLRGLRDVYRDQVFAKAKSAVPVQRRADLLDDIVGRLHADDSH